VAHYEDMLALYGTESGLRQARKHLGWYLDRHTSGVSDDLRRGVLTSFEPAQVISSLRKALTSFGESLRERNAA
jgi:tRNA-dihydrouridine synthase B